MERINYVSEEFQMICREQKVYLALSWIYEMKFSMAS
jgi:hypothetical protein